MNGTAPEAPVQIPLKLKYRNRKGGSRGGKGAYGGNSGTSMGKHVAHPLIHGFKRHGYRCEPKWNRHDQPA
jgi:hypothetical protein